MLLLIVKYTVKHSRIFIFVLFCKCALSKCALMLLLFCKTPSHIYLGCTKDMFSCNYLLWDILVFCGLARDSTVMLIIKDFCIFSGVFSCICLLGNIRYVRCTVLVLTHGSDNRVT